MNWHDDPSLRPQMAEEKARGRLLRSAIIWTPLFAVAGLATLFFFFDRLFLDGDNGGTWFLVVVLGVFAFLFGFQSIHALLDLFGGATETQGYVVRRWSRTDSLVMRSHYIRLDTKQILHVDALQHGEVKQGDYVRVRFFPHTATVTSVEKVAPPGSGDGEAPATLEA